MKKLILLFTLTLFLFNCSNDDDNNINVNDRLTVTFNTDNLVIIEGTSDGGLTIVDLTLIISGGMIFEDQTINIAVSENSTIENSDIVLNDLKGDNYSSRRLYNTADNYNPNFYYSRFSI